jgi:uncharacterized phage protein gp47/JayE
MAFQPRTFEQILLDMIAHVRANTTLTDFNVGSNIRTLLEAAALEDDEQYFQMVQLLDIFSFRKATGEDLDERAADFNLSRLGPKPSTVKLRYTNDNLTQSDLLSNVLLGATTITVQDSSDFPVSGFPYTVRIGEGTANVEDIAVSANNTSTGVLTVAALANNHDIGERVGLVTGSNQTISSGVLVQVPAQSANQPVVFQATEVGTLVAGNYLSNLVAALSTQDGSINNIGASKITQFSGSAPFSGAGVTNPTAASGGRDEETDAQFRERIKTHLQSLSRGTPLAIEGSVRGLEDTTSGQRVVSSKLIEDFTDEEHLLYIDDGTGFVPTATIMARSTLPGPIAAPTSTVTVADSSEFPSSGYVMISPEDSAQAEVVEYDSKDDSANQLNLVGQTANAHDASDEVILVDRIGIAEEGQNFFQLSDYPVRRNTIELYDDSTGVGTFLLRADGTDYFLNRTNGDVQYYGAGLPAGTEVWGHYTFYTGLFALAQKVINGDEDDPTVYPGVAAGGTIIYVDAPTVRQITILGSVSVKTGEDETAVRDDVQLAIETYIDGLSIGENVILARMIERSMRITGVENFKITSPESDIVILENEVPKSFDSSGNSLITVL